MVTRKIQTINLDQNIIDKSGYNHYMLKEIFQQPQTIANCLNQYIDFEHSSFKLPKLSFEWKNIKKINIIACGSSYYAASCAKYWFESIARISVEVEIASEFRYRDLCLEENGLTIFISQSGETADTLAALRYAKSLKQHTLCLVNVPTSSMAREADIFMEIHAGVEIGVAATKSFTAQLTSLICLILDCASQRNSLSSAQIKEYIDELSILPGKISTSLAVNDQVKIIAQEISKAKNILFIGRGTSFAIAQEGALKLKELSYIHAEALAAGELKHGTIALIDEEMPVIVIAPEDKLLSKTVSNANEIAARGGKIISFSSTQGNEALSDISNNQVNIIKSSDFLAPILYVISLQLLAYHTSCYLDNDVDQPRNLAKSVTVE
jgi:glucosamine--fructose-6-phosphate aminotransferase (isomerizing)